MKMNNNEAMDVEEAGHSVTRAQLRSQSRNPSRNRSLSHVKGPGRDKSGVRKSDVSQKLEFRSKIKFSVKNKKKSVKN